MEVGSQANEKVEEEEVRVLDEEEILAKIGGQESDIGFMHHEVQFTSPYLVVLNSPCESM